MMTSSRRYGLLALAMVLLGGCAQLPPLAGQHTTELALPAHWSADTAHADTVPPEDGARLAQWWRQLGDPQLDQLIDAALAGSLDLRLAQARLRQARAGRAQALSGRYPSLTASVGGSRSDSADVITSSPARTLYDAGFDAAWEIDVFGATQRGIEAATAELAASEASLNHSRVSLVAEVARNYVELRTYQQRAAILRANLASQDETLQITTWRYQAGLATESEVEQARASREQTRAAIPDLEVGRAAAEHRLAVLLGRNPGALREQLAAYQPLPAVPAAVASGIPADVLRQRPDLIAAEHSLAAETARLGQKQAQRFPSLNLGASFGWQAYSLGALGGADTVARAVSGALSVLLFDGGKLRSAIEIQGAVQEQALLDYRHSVLTALEEVENALTAYAAGRERVAARHAAFAAARNAARLARQMYAVGLTDFQQVLETERSRLTAEDSLATAEAGMHTSLIALYKALGGGWEPAPASSPSDRGTAS